MIYVKLGTTTGNNNYYEIINKIQCRKRIYEYSFDCDFQIMKQVKETHVGRLENY